MHTTEQEDLLSNGRSFPPASNHVHMHSKCLQQLCGVKSLALVYDKQWLKVSMNLKLSSWSYLAFPLFDGQDQFQFAQNHFDSSLSAFVCALVFTPKAFLHDTRTAHHRTKRFTFTLLLFSAVIWFHPCPLSMFTQGYVKWKSSALTTLKTSVCEGVCLKLSSCCYFACLAYFLPWMPWLPFPLFIHQALLSMLTFNFSLC